MSEKKVTDAEAVAAFDHERDNEAMYDADIAPKIEELQELCRRRGIPLFVVAQFSEFGVATWFSLPPGCHGLFGPLLRTMNVAVEKCAKHTGGSN